MSKIDHVNEEGARELIQWGNDEHKRLDDLLNGLQDNVDELRKVLEDVLDEDDVNAIIEELFPLPISKGGTGATDATTARANLNINRRIAYNVTGSLEEDTYDFWKNLEPGLYGFGSSNMLVGQPSPYGQLVHYNGNATGNPDIFQLFFRHGTPSGVYYRFANNANSTGTPMPSWKKLFDSNDVIPIVNGGTDSKTAKGAQYNLLKDMNAENNTVDDDSLFVGKYKNPNSETGTVYYRTASALWSYIKKQILVDDDIPIDVTENINDLTTGINLLYGTRDFVEYTNIVSVNGTDRPIDGFMKAGNPNYISFYKDNDGYTVCKIFRSENAAGNVIDEVANLVKAKSGDIFTVSVEVMIDNYDDWNYKDGDFLVARTITDQYTPVNRVSIKFSTIGVSKPENGKWYKASVSITATEGSSWLEVLLREAGNASVHFRKPKVEEGKINHPIWSPSPFDLVLGSNNDLTTGINLIRGSRDLTEGIISAELPDTSAKLDGFYHTTTQWERIVPNGVNEFAYARRLNTGSASHYLANALFAKDMNGNILTISFEFMFETQPTHNGVNLIVATGHNPDSSSSEYLLPTNSYFVTLADTKYKYSDIIPGQWYEAVIHTKVIDLSEEGYLRIGFAGNSSDITGKCLRKLNVEKGVINSPVWNASPFDITMFGNAACNLGLVDPPHTINSGDNLNDFILFGNYAAVTDADASAVLNTPPGVKTKFTLEVSCYLPSKPQYIRQILTMSLNSSTEYLRTSSDSGATWTDWRQTYANTTVRPIEGGGTAGTTAAEARTNLEVIGANNNGKYWGLATPAGDDNDWIRSTTSGFIPHEQNTSSGQGYLGSKTWPWREIHGKNLIGNLSGNWEEGGVANIPIKETKGHYVFELSANSGTNGFFKFATINITSNVFVNSPIHIRLVSRSGNGSHLPCDLYIEFLNLNNGDPGLNKFIYDLGDYSAYIHHVGTGQWDLYVKKSEAYDHLYVSDVFNRYQTENNSLTITWKNEFAESVPTDAVKATPRQIPLANIEHSSATKGNVLTMGSSGPAWLPAAGGGSDSQEIIMWDKSVNDITEPGLYCFTKYLMQDTDLPMTIMGFGSPSGPMYNIVKVDPLPVFSPSQEAPTGLHFTFFNPYYVPGYPSTRSGTNIFEAIKSDPNGSVDEWINRSPNSSNTSFSQTQGNGGLLPVANVPYLENDQLFLANNNKWTRPAMTCLRIRTDVTIPGDFSVEGKIVKMTIPYDTITSKMDSTQLAKYNAIGADESFICGGFVTVGTYLGQLNVSRDGTIIGGHKSWSSGEGYKTDFDVSVLIEQQSSKTKCAVYLQMMCDNKGSR